MSAKNLIIAMLLIASAVGVQAQSWRGRPERPRIEQRREWRERGEWREHGERHEWREPRRGWVRPWGYVPRAWVWAPGHWEFRWWIGPWGHREWRRVWVPPYRRAC